MSQLHSTGAVSLFCPKQVKHESILRLEKFAFVPPSDFLNACVGVCMSPEQTQHILLDEKTVKERILLFNHLNRFLFPSSLWYSGIHPQSWPLYKHPVVVLIQHLETFTLLPPRDNDISHIHSILIPVVHVVNTDKSPELHSFPKGGKGGQNEALQGPKTTATFL